MSKTQFQKYKSAQKVLQELFETPDNVVFVHYSCESFYDITDGRSPRITSIAIRYLGSGQTKSFSIHQEAELENLSLGNFEAEYDRLEKQMLEKFYDCVARLESKKWVHWNMRDANYGFEAIAHRYRVLGGDPIDIPDSHKIDLARVLYDYLGPKYIDHPRLPKLLELNSMVPRNFLSGADEAAAFENREYVKLHQSTLSKVDVIMNLAEAAIEDRLKCNNSYFERRGLSAATVSTIIKDHPLFIVFGVVGVILAFVANFLKLFG